MKKHITYSVLFAILLIIAESCGGLFSYGWDFECRATNVTTLFKEGVPVDTFNFYDTQRETRANKRSIKEKIYSEDSLFLSRDSVLNFFHTEMEYYDRGYIYNLPNGHFGLIVELEHTGNRSAGTLFISSEGYKLLELCDYDSVTMFYSFVIYPEN